MKHRNTYKTEPRSVRNLLTYTLAAVFIVCVMCMAFFAVTDRGTYRNADVVPETAYAVAVSDADDFYTKITDGSNTAIELQNNITLTEAEEYSYSTSSYGGTINGNGYTITISGAMTKSVGTASSQTDQYVGLLFGKFSGTLKNVVINFSGTYAIQASNANHTGDSDHPNSINTNSTTLYAGIICGEATSNAKFENVTLNVTDTGSFTAAGLDGSNDYGSGNGGVAGGFAARSSGARFDNCALNLNGIIHSFGQNNQAGVRENTSWGITEVWRYNDCSANTNASRAVSGGFVGELYGTGTTVFDDISVSGTGAIGAYTAGNSANGNQYALKANLSGLIVGFVYDTSASYNVLSMLYKFQGVIYANNRTSAGYLATGLLIGESTNGSHSVNSLWRDFTDNSKNSGVSQYGLNNSGQITSVSSTITAIKNSNFSSIETKQNSIQNLAIGSGATSVKFNNMHEYYPYANYNTTQASTYGTFTIDAIADDKLTVSVNIKSPYLLSALFFKSSAGGDQYNNAYTERTRTYTFTEAYSKTTNLTVYTARESNAMWTTYGESATSKEYDNNGFIFEGAPTIDTQSLAPNMKWVSVHDSNPEYNTEGTAFGNKRVTTSANAGTYTISLYKASEDGTLVPAENGDVLGANYENAPDTIYIYTKPSVPYVYEIRKIEVTLISLGVPITKTYDGTATIDASLLTYGEHIRAERVGGGDLPDVPTLSIGDGSYFSEAGSSEPSASAGDNKDAHIIGCTVTGNYVLAGESGNFVFRNCKINKKEMSLIWDDTLLVYNGNYQHPEATPSGLLEIDYGMALNIAYTVYTSSSMGSVTQSVDVGSYYVVATVSGDESNYSLPSNLDVTGRTFQITPKTVGLTWSGINMIYNTEIRTVSAEFNSGSIEAKDVNDVSVNIIYYTSSGSEVDMRNAGSYYAIAAINGNAAENYALNSSARCDGITISPMSVEIGYYTGSDSSVKDLEYIGKSYIDIPEGLHAKIVTQNSGLTADNIKISFAQGVAVRSVGEYKATATLVSSDSNPVIVTNYTIASGYNECVIRIVEKPLKLAYSPTAFTYNGYEKRPDVTVETEVYEGDTYTLTYTIYEVIGDVYNRITSAVNVGLYKLEVSISKGNYTIATGYNSVTFNINALDFSTSNEITMDPIAGAEYCAQEITPLPIVKYNGRTLNSGVDYTVGYSNNINAGIANVTVTGKGNFGGSKTQTFNITRKVLGIQFDEASASLIYNGEIRSVGAAFTGYCEGDTAPEIALTYYPANPKFVGSYTATAAFAVAQSNYALPDESYRTFKFTINPMSVSINIVPTDAAEDYIYDANTHLMTANWRNASVIPPADLGELSFIYNYYNNVTDVLAEPRDAGTYRVEVSLSGSVSENYQLESGSRSLIYTIEQRTISVTFNDEINSSFVYNAEKRNAVYDYDVSAVIAGYSPNFSVTYTKDGQGVSGGAPVNAGIYNAQITALNKNYRAVSASGSASPSGLLVIAPAELRPILSVASESKTYDGTYFEATYSYYEGFGMKGNDNINLDILYYLINEDGSETAQSSCRNAGKYVARLSLPETNTNYYFNNEQSVLERNFEITKREIGYVFSHSGERTYDGTDIYVTVGVSANGGLVEGMDFTGVIDSDNIGDLNFVTVVKDEDGNTIDFIHDVGVYTAEVTFENINYRLTDNAAYKNSVTVTIVKKSATFIPKEIRKTFGTRDNATAFEQTLTTELGIEGEELVVTLIRNPGEDCGVYQYSGVNLPENSNYAVSMTPDTSVRGAFYIDKRNVTVEPNVFEIDYKDAVPELIQIVTVQTDAIGAVTLTIRFTRLTNETEVGVYDLSPEFTVEGDNAANFNVLLTTDGTKGKFIINGRSVLVVLDTAKLSKVYSPVSAVDPDFIDAIISVDLDNCADDIRTAYETYKAAHNGSDEGFPWGEYISITRADASNHNYKEGGYAITISFLRNGMIDKNYRAVTPDNVTYVFTIEKLDLRGGMLPIPDIQAAKNYDGTTTAKVIAHNIPMDYYNQGLRVSANYSDKNAGIDKAITVSYAFSFSMYEGNYILPAAFEYEVPGEIGALELTAEIRLTSSNIVYGNIPDTEIIINGFIGSENASSEGIELDTYYADGIAADVIRDVSSYTMVLRLISSSSVNYTVNYKSASCEVRISPKQVAVTNGEAYVKPVDGTTSVPGFGAENYSIVGLLDKDTSNVDITYSAILSASEPGSAVVTVNIDALIGSQSVNYTLTNDTFTVPATILKLADVVMTDASYPYDTSAKPVIPELTNILDGVTYVVEYSGRGGTVYDTTDEAPVNAGEYLARCYLKMNNGDSEYERFAAECYLTITKITPEIYFDGVFTQTYGSFTPITAKAVGAGLDEAIAVEYSFVEPGENIPKFAPAGNHMVTARFQSTQNYFAVSKETSLVIKQKSVTVTFSGYTGLVYNGLDRAMTDEIKVTFNGVVDGDTCEPVKTFSPGVVKNAGTYFLEVRPANENYKTTGSISITFSIAKKTLIVSATAPDVEAGTTPVFNITYEGFIENDDETDLTIAPSVNLTYGQVGTNKIVFNNGMDENYDFVYKEGVYNITYTVKQPQTQERNITVTVIIVFAVIGAIGLIILLGFLVKTYTYRSMYNVSSVKREVRNRINGENGSKRK